MASATLEAPAPAAAADDHEHDEVVGGARIETPRMGTYETCVASTLGCDLGSFVRFDGLGRCNIEMLFRIDLDENLQRRPDVAVVTYARRPKGRRRRPTTPGTSCRTWPWKW